MVWVGRNPEKPSVPLPALNRDTHSSISAQRLIQPDLGCLQGWGTHHLSVLSTPHLDAVLQVRSHSTEQRGRITSLALLAVLLWMQPRVWLAFWAIIHQNPQCFSGRLLSGSSFSSLCTSGIILTPVQQLTLGPLESHVVHVGLLFKHVQDHLDVIPSFCVSSANLQRAHLILLSV